MHTRSAILPDAVRIHDIILDYSQQGTLLPRNVSELSENIRDFLVVEDEGEIVGCGALHFYGPHLTEIRSIAVVPGHKGKGAGRFLVDALMAETERHKVSCVCLFTRIPNFFAHFGFRIAKREDLPDKIYKDCLSCPKLHACDEVAMVKGVMPAYASLGGIRVPARCIEFRMHGVMVNVADDGIATHESALLVQRFVLAAGAFPSRWRHLVGDTKIKSRQFEIVGAVRDTQRFHAQQPPALVSVSIT